MIGRWLEERREGREQDPPAIEGFVQAALSGAATRAQIGAWLAFVALRGMTPAETVALTRAMADSGDRLRWDGVPGPFWDKHSTGGIGDKVSLVLAPLWAALGIRVPMISGRGLGITGGTLDKLESVPGFDVALDEARMREVLAGPGCFIAGPTARLAPADGLLYALRDETQTVPSVPLITASILSKKLAEGIERLVLDVKFGSGAFMRSEAAARELADSLVAVGCGAGLETEAILTPMHEPLGEAVGNALEVEEAVAALQGGGPADLTDLTVRLSGCGERARRALRDGSAYDRWQRMVRAQGGDPAAPYRGLADTRRWEFRAARDGMLARCDAGEIGRAVFALGAGRERAGEPVHPGVGARILAKSGARVRRGDVLAVLYHAERGLDAARAHLASAFVYREE